MGTRSSFSSPCPSHALMPCTRTGTRSASATEPTTPTRWPRLSPRSRPSTRRRSSKIALAWQVHLSSAMLPIPGTTSLAHLRENIAAARDAGDDPRLEEAADIMASLAEQAYAAGEMNPGEMAHDDLPFDLLDDLAVETDPRAERLRDLMRARGWTGWTRLERAGGAAQLTSRRCSPGSRLLMSAASSNAHVRGPRNRRTSVTYRRDG